MDDNQRYSQIISECLKSSTEALEEIKKFKEFAKETIPKTQEGISFFDVKNHEMLAYLTDLSYLMAKISVGESIENDPSVNRLIKLRVILEKMKPIEGKLRPQVDRLIGSKSAKTGESSLRARPDQFIVSDKEDGDSEDDEMEEEKSKKYVPPKIHAVQYEGDEHEKEARKLEQAKRRAMQSSLIRDLHAQYSEAPEEVFDESRAKESKNEKERRQYEEANFVRLQVNKKEQAQEKKRKQMDDLDTLLNFGDYMADGGKKSGAKRKRTSAGGGGKGQGKGTKRFKKSPGGKKGGKRKSFKKK